MPLVRWYTVRMDKTIERWRDVVGYEGLYRVSSHGRVRSLDRITTHGHRRKGQILAQHQRKDGRLSVGMSRGNRKETHYVHQLVALTFLGGRPDGLEVCHGDGNPANNMLENLRFDTHSGNERDKLQHGTHYLSNRTHCPRGHALQEPNLSASHVRQGHRKCLACSRAQSYTNYHPELRGSMQQVSDRYYEAIQQTAPAH